MFITEDIVISYPMALSKSIERIHLVHRKVASSKSGCKQLVLIHRLSLSCCELRMSQVLVIGGHRIQVLYPSFLKILLPYHMSLVNRNDECVKDSFFLLAEAFLELLVVDVIIVSSEIHVHERVLHLVLRHHVISIKVACHHHGLHVELSLDLCNLFWVQVLWHHASAGKHAHKQVFLLDVCLIVII